MSHRIVSHIGTTVGMRQRRPRIKSADHLTFIRTLPCVICGAPGSDPAHLRAGYALIGKRPVGVAEKPDDKFVTPLCRKHHVEQHAMTEHVFWRIYGVPNPWQLCLALWSVSGNLEAGEAIIAEHRKLVR